MAIQITPYIKETIKLQVENNILFISGNIDGLNPGVILNSFFEELHNSIIQNKLSFFDINVQNLSFINSAGIKGIVEWILKIDSLPVDQRYRLNFFCSSKYIWQEASFSSLVFLNPTILNLKID